MKPDLVDALLAPGGHVGEETPPWEKGAGKAAEWLKKGSSLTVFKSPTGDVIRYTLHWIGEPYVLAPEVGAQLLAELPLKEIWTEDHLGKAALGGTLTLYQVG